MSTRRVENGLAATTPVEREQPIEVREVMTV